MKTIYVMSRSSADCIRKYGTIGQKMKYLPHRAKSPEWLAHKLYDTPWRARWGMDSGFAGPEVRVTRVMAFPYGGKAVTSEARIAPFLRRWDGALYKGFTDVGEEWRSEPDPSGVKAFLNETADAIEGKAAADFRRALLREHPQWLEIKQVSSLPTFRNGEDGKADVRYVEASMARRGDGSVAGETAERSSSFGFRYYRDPCVRLCGYRDLERYPLE